jgi:hypothetical protein
MAHAGLEDCSYLGILHLGDRGAEALPGILVCLEDGSAATEGFVTINSCSSMFTTIIIVAIVCVVVYFLRRNFRRA